MWSFSVAGLIFLNNLPFIFRLSHKYSSWQNIEHLLTFFTVSFSEYKNYRSKKIYSVMFQEHLHHLSASHHTLYHTHMVENDSYFSQMQKNINQCQKTHILLVFPFFSCTLILLWLCLVFSIAATFILGSPSHSRLAHLFPSHSLKNNPFIYVSD